MDVILSSGFLAFARQSGFLLAIEEVGVEAGAVVGTSSGALAGVLWAAGYPAAEVARLLSERAPLRMTRPAWPPWRGMLSLQPGLERLRGLIPATFEELPRPFAVGVATPQGVHRLLHTGPLPEAVMASCAVPRLFAAVGVGGESFSDGGAVDRAGVTAWRAWRGGRGVLHLVERSHGAAATPDVDGLVVARTPRSGARLWGLGDFAAQLEEARVITRASLEAAGEVAVDPTSDRTRGPT